MSRIFDALQRSGTEQSGVEYPDMVSVATAVFEAPQDSESVEVAEGAAHVEAPAIVPLQDLDQDAAAELQTRENAERIPAFPSLEVSVAPFEPSRFLYATREPCGREIPFPGCSSSPDATEPLSQESACDEHHPGRREESGIGESCRSAGPPQRKSAC